MTDRTITPSQRFQAEYISSGNKVRYPGVLFMHRDDWVLTEALDIGLVILRERTDKYLETLNEKELDGAISVMQHEDVREQGDD